MIILLLEPMNYVHVREAVTVQRVQSRLEKAFEFLHKLIYDYVKQIETTVRQLDGIEFAFSEEQVGTKLARYCWPSSSMSIFP